MKSKRALAATAVAGAAVIAGGTATAAAVTGGAQPEDLASAAALPPAQTAAAEQAGAEQAPADTGKARQDAADQRDQAAQGATQQASATAAAQTEKTEKQEKEEEPQQAPAEDSDSSGGDASSDSGSSGGGQGGTCQASMYGEGQLTASGETFDPSAMTAAHKELPFGTQVEVTNPANGKSVTVTINDRGPFVAGRCLDLSTASFETIASSGQGVVDVEWQVVGSPDPPHAAPGHPPRGRTRADTPKTAPGDPRWWHNAPRAATAGKTETGGKGAPHVFRNEAGWVISPTDL